MARLGSVSVTLALVAACGSDVTSSTSSTEGAGGATTASSNSASSATSGGAPPTSSVSGAECIFDEDCGDAPDCIDRWCSGRQCMEAPTPAGTPCGNLACCDGMGLCIGGCISDAACPQPPGACVSVACVGCGTCEFAYLPAGTPAGPQIGGDCQIAVCDGMGGQMTEADDSDLLDDGNPCTDDVCADGVPANYPVCPAPPMCPPCP